MRSTLILKNHNFWTLMTFNIPTIDMKSSTHILSRKDMKLQVRVGGKRCKSSSSWAMVLWIMHLQQSIPMCHGHFVQNFCKSNTPKTYMILKDHNVLCKIAQGFILIILLGSEPIKILGQFKLCKIFIRDIPPKKIWFWRTIMCFAKVSPTSTSKVHMVQDLCSTSFWAS